jgi:putative copper export protein
VIAELTDWLLFLHILAAIVWLGGLIMLGLLATLVLRSRDAEAVGRFVRNLCVVGPAVFAPAMLAVLGLGIWMVVHDDP